jgi:tetratricopeptide (TPR) repeat protein
MAPKASIFLLLFILISSGVRAGTSFESDLRESIQKNDWPEQVLLLSGRKGQNFEHDLLLAKALLQLERRTESLKLLTALYQSHRDERVSKLLQLAGGIFFNQETSNLYFEGIRFLSVSKFSEARERFEQALSREPGNALVLTRLVQVEILLGLNDPASARLKEAISMAPQSPELKAFAVKLALMADELNKGETPRTLALPRKPYPSVEVPFVFTLEALKRWGRIEEIRTIANSISREHPKWVYAMTWLYSNALVPEKTRKNLKAQIDRELKQRDRFEKDLEKEMKQSQYFWVGYYSLEELVKNSR